MTDFQKEAHYLAQQLRDFMAKYNIFYNQDLINAIDALEDIKELDRKVNQELYFIGDSNYPFYLSRKVEPCELTMGKPEEMQKEILGNALIFENEQEAVEFLNEMQNKGIIEDMGLNLEVKKVSEFEFKS